LAHLDFGELKDDSTYVTIRQVFEWALWGIVGPLLAVGVYPVIFKQFPPRWMGITSIALIGFGTILTALVLVGEAATGEEFDLENWRDFVHGVAATATLWFAFSLKPQSSEAPKRPSTNRPGPISGKAEQKDIPRKPDSLPP
jgi:hypothetical protein